MNTLVSTVEVTTYSEREWSLQWNQGIYIQGSYGVRWEDLLLLDSGVEYLTNYEKRTQVLDSNG